MPMSNKASRARASKLDDPAIVATMREYAVKKAAYPNSHRFSCRSVAVEIDRRHGVRVDAKTVRSQLKKLGIYHPWSRRPNAPLH
ncbi:hypothetical protein PTE30175_02544 [Pandoraea terrae]|uniref:Transposase n=1 Tax=Pandoraea terrae TaxID=1537710 RepID=A0A5E4VEC8_9BURK|nr:hypothetical protein PTE30175_02544 [Pandoraea terrae]